jgi:hypothetical protein
VKRGAFSASESPPDGHKSMVRLDGIWTLAGLDCIELLLCVGGSAMFKCLHGPLSDLHEFSSVRIGISLITFKWVESLTQISCPFPVFVS